MPPAPRGILLDIEGTTTPIAFVYDVLFPYARRAMPAYLAAHWTAPSLQPALEHVAIDAGHASLAAWRPTPDAAAAHLLALMDGDAKTTGLKAVQGLVWAGGYASGALHGQVFPDVPDALRRWHAAGLDVRVYSSGSIAAQQLLFGHSTAGDLRPYLRGHYDTTTGPKRASASYAAIAKDMALDMALDPGALLFLSDIVEELDAAREAGLQTGLMRRPGNKPVDDTNGHGTYEDFAIL